jgi:thioredoxin 1
MLLGCAELTYVLGAAAGPVNDTTFEELVLKSPVPVMVDFWAPWCGPCRMIAPLIDELATEYGEKIRAVRAREVQEVQLDKARGIAMECGSQAPTG